VQGRKSADLPRALKTDDLAPFVVEVHTRAVVAGAGALFPFLARLERKQEEQAGPERERVPLGGSVAPGSGESLCHANMVGMSRYRTHWEQKDARCSGRRCCCWCCSARRAVSAKARFGVRGVCACCKRGK
jgi:hypothetical protein